MNICLFSEDEIGKELKLKDERAQHLIKILHKKEGDTFYAGIIGGRAGTAQIEKISSEGTISFSLTAQSDGKPLNPLKMIIGFPRPIQLKRLLRDVAALGVCEVHLTGTDLGEKSYMQSTLVEKGNAYRNIYQGVEKFVRIVSLSLNRIAVGVLILMLTGFAVYIFLFRRI